MADVLLRRGRYFLFPVQTDERVFPPLSLSAFHLFAQAFRRSVGQKNHPHRIRTHKDKGLRIELLLLLSITRGDFNASCDILVALNGAFIQLVMSKNHCSASIQLKMRG